MTAHSIDTLSELKMSSFGLYAGKKMHALSINCTSYQLHSVEGCAKCLTVPQLRKLVTGAHTAGHGSK